MVISTCKFMALLIRLHTIKNKPLSELGAHLKFGDSYKYKLNKAI